MNTQQLISKTINQGYKITHKIKHLTVLYYLNIDV